MLALVWSSSCALTLGSAFSAAPPAFLPQSTLSSLTGAGFAVLPNFLTPDQVAAIKGDVGRLKAEGRFSVAGVGDASTNRLDSQVRRCEQCFLYPKIKHGGGGDAAGRSVAYDMIDRVADSLADGTGIALDGLLTEGLFAFYPNGGFYRRHIDAVAGTASEIRQWSYLIYLNSEWAVGDGGELRIHTDGGGELPPPGAAPSFVDVEPRAGTLVLFRSNVPHEVLDTARERLAIAGWFNVPAQGSQTRRGLIGVLAPAVAAVATVKFGLGALFGGGGDE